MRGKRQIDDELVQITISIAFAAAFIQDGKSESKGM